jgi:CRISPR-associated protein Cmr2
MVHEAKDKGDRNAVGIAVLKHSGEINKTILKWDLGHYSNKITAESIKLLEDLVKELNDEEEGFSNTFIKNVNIELQKMDVVDEDILKTELGRLLERACCIKDKKRKRDKVFDGRDNWRDRIFNFYIEAKNVEGPKKENFLSFLNIADFLARKVKR